MLSVLIWDFNVFKMYKLCIGWNKIVINMDLGERRLEDWIGWIGSPSSRTLSCDNGFPHFLAAPQASTSDSLMQQVLLYNQCTPVTCSRQGLSPEAVKVLDELPDLSFLQAKLLMFPVQGTLLWYHMAFNVLTSFYWMCKWTSLERFS